MTMILNKPAYHMHLLQLATTECPRITRISQDFFDAAERHLTQWSIKQLHAHHNGMTLHAELGGLPAGNHKAGRR